MALLDRLQSRQHAETIFKLHLLQNSTGQCTSRCNTQIFSMHAILVNVRN